MTDSTAVPRLNEPAPEFEAKTTHGMRKLADCRGKWLVLFSHPADFTLVCRTEFVRLLTALQTSDANGVATPEGRRPGEKVIVPPPQTAQGAKTRASEGYDYTDWCFSKRQL